MAAIYNRLIHKTVQDFDIAAVTLNEKNLATDVDGHAALLCEYLGIEHWINIHHTYATEGVDAAVNLVTQLHEDLPTIQENDLMEEQAAEKTADQIGKVLSWVDLDKNTEKSPEKPVESLEIDVSTLVRSNPLINFSLLSEEDRAHYSESLDQLTQSEGSSNTDTGIPVVPTDSPRMLELRASEKKSMLWKLPNHSNLSPLTIDVWKKLANLTRITDSSPELHPDSTFFSVKQITEAILGYSILR
ncbi:hypothetical protein R1sor_016108 [Riccia sorocarpa]|uniref:Uncharacterized protein n=1 Tax=Riccia sorocarpa TaxID=122646 RepID=A0ABD3HI38_9MARC